MSSAALSFVNAMLRHRKNPVTPTITIRNATKIPTHDCFFLRLFDFGGAVLVLIFLIPFSDADLSSLEMVLGFFLGIGVETVFFYAELKSVPL